MIIVVLVFWLLYLRRADTEPEVRVSSILPAWALCSAPGQLATSGLQVTFRPEQINCPVTRCFHAG